MDLPIQEPVQPTFQSIVIPARHNRLYLSYQWRRYRHALARHRHPVSGRFLKAVEGKPGGNRCLLIHLTDPFLRKDVDVRHQNRWQARELARLAAEIGFVVDVMDPIW
jgi:hypothetical protein